MPKCIKCGKEGMMEGSIGLHGFRIGIAVEKVDTNVYICQNEKCEFYKLLQI